MASASYSLPQKILDEMIVDEGPEGRDITGDGTVLFHRTKRRDAPVIGKRHPKKGDECIVRWRERWTDGMNISDGDEPCILGQQSTHVVGENTLPYEPPGIHDALPLMEIGDTVRLRLHVSKTSNRLEPAACELELVTFYRVDDCDGLRRKVARHNEELYKGITPLSDVSVRKSVVEGFSAFKLAAEGALVDAPEGAEAYRGRARDFELGKALNGLCEGDIALVEAGDTIYRIDVELVRSVVDCSEEGDESVLKLEISAPAHSEPAVRGVKGDVKLRVASGLWVIDDEIVGDVDCTPGVGSDPEFMALSSLSPPLRLAVARMAVDETAEVTFVDAERSDKAEARYRIVLEGVRNAVDLGDGVAYKVLNKGAHGPSPEPLDDVVVCVEEMDVTALPLNLTWTLDDDDENVAGAALEKVVTRLRPGERASVDFKGKGPMDATRGVVTLERIHRRQALIDLKPRQRIERAADMKARGNRAFASKDFAKAVRRYGGGIDAAAKDLEPDLDEEAVKERRALASALYLNRAAARLELKEFKGALSDCDEVLEREPLHIKALYRRGRCCLEMDDWPAAKKAFASVLEIDEANKDARRGLLKVREAVKRQKALDRARFGGKTVAKGFSEARPAPAAPAVAKPPEPTPANRRSAVTAGLVIAGMFVAVAAIGWYGLLG